MSLVLLCLVKQICRFPQGSIILIFSTWPKEENTELAAMQVSLLAEGATLFF